MVIRINESQSSSVKYYGVFSLGGSIGDNSCADDSLVKHFGRDVGVLVKVFSNSDEAKEYAKSARARLSPGERKYYGISYRVSPLSQEDMSCLQAKDLVREESSYNRLVKSDCSLKERASKKENSYRVYQICMDVAVPGGQDITAYGLNSSGNGKLFHALSQALESEGLAMAGDFISADDNYEDLTTTYKDNDYEFFSEGCKVRNELNEYYVPPLKSAAVMHACSDMDIKFETLKYQSRDPNYSNADSYTFIAGKDKIDSCQLKLQFASYTCTGLYDQLDHQEVYYNSLVFIFFNRSKSGKSSLTIVPRKRFKDDDKDLTISVESYQRLVRVK